LPNFVSLGSCPKSTISRQVRITILFLSLQMIFIQRPATTIDVLCITSSVDWQLSTSLLGFYTVFCRAYWSISIYVSCYHMELQGTTLETSLIGHA